MSDLKRYTELKEKVEEAQQKVDRAQGAIDNLLMQLQEKFSCDSLDAAHALLKKLDAKIEKLTTELDNEMTRIERKWPDER